MTDKLRLFTAFEVKETVRFYAPTRLAETLKVEDIPQLSVEHKDNMHITLNFLGIVPESSVEGILGHIEETARHFGNGCDGIAASYGDIGGFPDLQDPRVLYLGVRNASEDRDEPSIYDVQSDLERRLSEFTSSAGGEKYDYKPHITLARFSRRAALSDGEQGWAVKAASLTLDTLKREVGDIPGYLDYKLNRIALLRSVRTPNGQVTYHKLGGAAIPAPWLRGTQTRLHPKE